MARVPIKDISDAFKLLFYSLADREFKKTTAFEHWTERDFLLPVRFFLLGWFGHVKAEASARKTLRKKGRFDFLIENTAIELAVQTGESSPNMSLSMANNQSEVTKLLKHKGPSILVLIDLRKTASLSKEKLAEYRKARIKGKGNHNATSFTVLYFHRDLHRVCPEKLQVRPKQRKN
jgi:hypothetical protein